MRVTIDTNNAEQRAQMRGLLDLIEGRRADNSVEQKPATLQIATDAAGANIVTTADIVPSTEVSGEEMRKAAAAAAKRIGAEGPAKVKAFVGTLEVKSIADVPPEKRADALKKLEVLV